MAAPQPADRAVKLRPGPRVLVLACLAVVALLALQVLLHGPMVEMDQDITHWFAAHRHALLTEAMLWVSELHRTVALLAATALIAGWRLARRDRRSARALLVVPAAMLLNVGLKESFRRVRPVLEDPLVQLATYSFPSGHAVASTVFYGMLASLVVAHSHSRLQRALAACLAVVMVLLVCFSRVYLGAHYFSDVIAGTAIGTACVVLFFSLVRR